MKPVTWVVRSLALLVAVGCGSATEKRNEVVAGIRSESTASELVKKAEASASVGDTTRAEQYYVAALKAGGDPHAIVPKLVVVCVADQRYPAALEHAEQHLARHPKDLDVAFAAASLHVAVGDPVRARGLLEQVLKNRPDWPEAHYALASILRSQGEELDAADQHDIAYLKLSPRGPFAERVLDRLRKDAP